MSKVWSQVFEKALLDASSYREFLSVFLKKNPAWNSPRPLSYQEFSIRSGFSSRSYLHDIIGGRRSISTKSFERVCLGLGLSENWKEYFLALVGQEEESFQTRKMSVRDFIVKQDRARAKITKSQQRKVSKTESPELLKVVLDKNFPEVYAALGRPLVGSSIDVIASRAGLSRTVTESVLKKLMDVGIVNLSSDGLKYFVQNDELLSDNLQNSEVLERDYFRSLEKLRQRFKKQSAEKEALFLTLTFSINKADLLEFRNEIKKVALKYSQEAENPDGDTVAELCIGLTKSN